MGSAHTKLGQFRQHYRALRRQEARRGGAATTPVILSEGDSWFSTPLYNNLLDAIEYGSQALMLRVEKSGDVALSMFAGRGLDRLVEHVRTFEFDLMAVSAGGNDLVDDFLAQAFRGRSGLDADDALRVVRATGRFKALREAYQRLVDRIGRAAPQTRIVAHSYDYPRLLGVPARLTVPQLGLAALFKHSIGDWIERHIRTAIASRAERERFVRLLVDAFVEDVLERVQGAGFSYVDLRGSLTRDAQWNDEMHPTQAGFVRLARRYALGLRRQLPAAKRAAIGVSGDE